MKAPIIKAFKDSDGYLPEIHKAAIKVIFEQNKKYKKFQTPENWFIQLAKISDLSIDWISPELLIRRLIYAKESYLKSKPENNNNEFYNKIVQKNFDNPDKILEYINKKDKPSDKQTLLFNHPEFLKA